mgnify:CR=1 FL=1
MYWLVDFPTHQYNEDVKVLAQKAGLLIRDSRFTDSIDKSLIATKTPKLTTGVKKARKPRKNKADE